MIKDISPEKLLEEAAKLFPKAQFVIKCELRCCDLKSGAWNKSCRITLYWPGDSGRHFVGITFEQCLGSMKRWKKSDAYKKKMKELL